MTFLFMTLAFANELREPPELEDQLRQVCRHAHSAREMAVVTAPLRIQSELLDLMLRDLIDTQLPQLKAGLNTYAELLEPADQDKALADLDQIMLDLDASASTLRRSLDRSHTVALQLAAPRRPGSPRGLARREQSVELCTSSQLALSQAVTATGETMIGQEASINRITALLLQVLLKLKAA